MRRHPSGESGDAGLPVLGVRAGLPGESEDEKNLSTLLTVYAGPRPWELRHPWAALRAFLLLRRLPVHSFHPSGTTEGAIIANRLKRSHFGVSTVLHEAVALIEISGSGEAWNGNKSARKHARRALRAGVEWERVTDRAQKVELLQQVQTRLQPHLMQYHGATDIDTDTMLASGLWLVGSLDGRPLVVAAAATDGEWSVLTLFCRLESTAVAGSTRYLMTQVLVEELSSRGVRYACDSASPLRLPAGLRHFARMVGFRIHRVRVR